MPEQPIIPRERALLRELASLVEYRGKTEDELTEKLAAGREASDAQFSDALKRIGTLSDKEQASIRGEFEAKIAASKESFEKQLAEARAGMDAQLGAFNEK